MDNRKRKKLTVECLKDFFYALSESVLGSLEDVRKFLFQASDFEAIPNLRSFGLKLKSFRGLH